MELFLSRLWFLIGNIAVLTCSQELSGQDSYYCSQAKKVLSSLDVDYESVEIADGSNQGGKRNLIIGYSTSYDKSKQISELVQVLELGYVLNNKLNANLDEVTAVVGSKSGAALAVITTDTYNVGRFMQNKDSKRYVSNWTVLRIDKSYLPDLLALAKSP